MASFAGFFRGNSDPGVFSAVFLLFPLARQGVATTFAGVLAVLGPTVGPIVGGWITETYSWHWLFLINVAPGIVAAIVAGSPVAEGADAAGRGPQARCDLVDPVGDWACRAGDRAQGSADARLEFRPRHGPIGGEPRKLGRLCHPHAQSVAADRQADALSSTEASRSVAFSVSYWESASSAPFISCRFFWRSSEATMLWRSA